MTESTLRIAIWLERRLDMSLDFHLPAARLYGIVVHDLSRLEVDEHAAARSTFIGEDSDAYALVAGACGVLARSFDAAAIVTTGWAAPMQDDLSMSHRPSRHPQRRRVRAVCTIDDVGLATVLRFADDPEHFVAESTRGVGDMADAMEAMWFGRSADIVNLRTTRGGCARRP